MNKGILIVLSLIMLLMSLIIFFSMNVKKLREGEFSVNLLSVDLLRERLILNMSVNGLLDPRFYIKWKALIFPYYGWVESESCGSKNNQSEFGNILECESITYASALKPSRVNTLTLECNFNWSDAIKTLPSTFSVVLRWYIFNSQGILLKESGIVGYPYLRPLPVCDFTPSELIEYFHSRCKAFCEELDGKLSSSSIEEIKATDWCCKFIYPYHTGIVPLPTTSYTVGGFLESPIPIECPTKEKCYTQNTSERCSFRTFSKEYPELIKVNCSFHLTTGELCNPDAIEDGWIKCCENPSLENCNCK